MAMAHYLVFAHLMVKAQNQSLEPLRVLATVLHWMMVRQMEIVSGHS
jgi:hypothetical protein